MMPGLDGYKLLHLLKREDHFKDIPFLFLTGSAEKSDIKKGLDAGATDYIIKPFDPDELVQFVHKYLGE